jgi:hypothetical protein
MFGDDVVLVRISENNAEKLVVEGYGKMYNAMRPTDEYSEMHAFFVSNRFEQLNNLDLVASGKINKILLTDFSDELECVDKIEQSDLDLFYKIKGTTIPVHQLPHGFVDKDEWKFDRWEFDRWEFAFDDEFFTEVRRRFPMLSMLNRWDVNSNTESHVKDYISMMVEREKVEEKETVAA